MCSNSRCSINTYQCFGPETLVLHPVLLHPRYFVYAGASHRGSEQTQPPTLTKGLAYLDSVLSPSAIIYSHIIALHMEYTASGAKWFQVTFLIIKQFFLLCVFLNFHNRKWKISYWFINSTIILYNLAMYGRTPKTEQVTSRHYKWQEVVK